MRTEAENRAWELQAYGMTSDLIRSFMQRQDVERVYDACMALAGHLSNMQEEFCNQESPDQTPEENKLRQELNVAKFILFEYIMDKVRGSNL